MQVNLRNIPTNLEEGAIVVLTVEESLPPGSLPDVVPKACVSFVYQPGLSARRFIQIYEHTTQQLSQQNFILSSVRRKALQRESRIRVRGQILKSDVPVG